MPFSGFQDFNPAFGSPLQQFIAAHPGIVVNSGYRSPEHQADLFAAAVRKYGSPEAARHWVAPAGHSQHNLRNAADLGFSNDAARAWAHANAAKYGLIFPMGHEPWHVELVGARSGGGGGDMAMAGPDDSTAALLSDAVMPRSSYDLSSLASGAETQLAGGDRGNQPRMVETGGDTAAPPLEIEQASLSPDILAAPYMANKRPSHISPSPLADLFNVKTIGQAGVPPAVPGRRF